MKLHDEFWSIDHSISFILVVFTNVNTAAKTSFTNLAAAYVVNYSIEKETIGIFIEFLLQNGFFSATIDNINRIGGASVSWWNFETHKFHIFTFPVIVMEFQVVRWIIWKKGIWAKSVSI